MCQWQTQHMSTTHKVCAETCRRQARLQNFDMPNLLRDLPEGGGWTTKTFSTVLHIFNYTKMTAVLHRDNFELAVPGFLSLHMSAQFVPFIHKAKQLAVQDD